MTPSVLRQSGPKSMKDGQIFTPRAVIHFCRDCNFEGAPFGDTIDGRREYFCGWVNNEPTCINRGKTK